jgi:hypothetical protein
VLRSADILITTFEVAPGVLLALFTPIDGMVYRSGAVCVIGSVQHDLVGLAEIPSPQAELAKTI